jgi:hypothetical protein
MVLASLLYAVVIVGGLLVWPRAPGIFASGATLAGRWLSALNGLFTIGVALLVMRRVPGNACGPLLLLWGVGVLGWSQPIDWGNPALSSIMAVLYQFYFFGVSFSALVSLLYVFPTGHVAPTWMTWPVIVSVVTIAILGALSATIFNTSSMVGGEAVGPNPIFSPAVNVYRTQLGTLLLMVPLTMMLGAVMSLAWRYRHASTRERQQVKVLVFGFAVLVIEAMVVLTIGGIERPDATTDLALFFSVLNFMAWQALPAIILAVTIARYKLWDIDLVIRRAASYAILTALLLLVYLGSILLLQGLFTRLTGNTSTLATILSTLLIAALFLPLRRRIQGLIDRRFYRRKYDAARVLERFAATARDETDLDALTAELLAVIRETMQPESVSLWLKKTTDDGRQTTAPVSVSS